VAEEPLAGILSTERLLGQARESAGLTDLDDADETLGSRLDLLIEQLEPRLVGDPGATARAAAVIRGLLVTRLQVIGDRARYPIADEVIERPVIAFGEARSGTTLLQMLLGCDPDARLLEFWEAMRPSPPPGVAADVAERRAACDAEWREILDQIPRWLISHPYNAMLSRNPPECERLWAIDFRSMPPTAWWRVPTVPLLPPQITLPQDPVRQYEIHKMTLQHLQYGQPERRWVLKGVTHQRRLEALLDAYPDAIFVWIHRDPLIAIASRYELHAQIFEGIAGRIDREAFAAATIASCLDGFRQAATDPCAEDPRIHHLLYRDVVADPIDAVARLYERCNLDFTAGLDKRMRTWMIENDSARFGTFTYGVDALGVDVATLDAELEPYRERFGVPREDGKG
jgi:hypothetical protein